MHGTAVSAEKPIQKKYRTITLTHRAPVQIAEDEWPVIAQGICCNDIPEAPYGWEVAIRVRSKAPLKDSFFAHIPQYIIHASYKAFDDSCQADCDDDKNNQQVRVGRMIYESNPDLYNNILEVGEELRARILAEKMRIFVTHAVDRCFANLPAREA